MTLNYTKKACSITDNIFRQIVSGLRKDSFETEKDIDRFIRAKIKENKCKLAFSPIVSMGKNASEIHHKPNDTKLSKGFLMMDFGAKYKGICSDCTRTVYLGKPDNKERKLYRLVKEAQELCVELSFDGMSLNDIDAIARDGLVPYRKMFVHSLGHGVGKRIHQAPSLGPNKKGVLKIGQVITIEPGIYFKNRSGIRIEDTLVVGKNKGKRLTKTSKELIII